MSFIAKNPLTIPKVSKAPSAPIQGARGLFAKEDGWYDIDDSGNERKIISEDDLSTEIPEVIDNLTSTDTEKALSANQGKVLNDGKADKATTIIGYGITDAYTKNEVDNALSDKADREEMLDKLCPHTTISGYPVSITDHLQDESVIDYKIYGNSVQDGTPSPDSPVEIKSVGDLVTDTASEHYGKYDVPVTVTGKNLLNTYGFSAQGINTPSSQRYLNNPRGTTISTINPSDSITITQVYNSAYNINSYYNGYFCIGINEEIKRDIKYRISFDIDITSNPGNATYIMILPNGNTQHNINIQEGRISGLFNYTIYSGVPTRRYIEFRCMGMSFTISNIMITYAENEDIEYEPYVEPITQHIYLDEPLRKVGDYADYINFKNQKVIRQVDVLDDTGTKSIEESYGTLDTTIEGSITVPELTTPISSVANISTETEISPSNMDVEYYQDINTVINNLTNAILSQGGNV